MQNGEIKSLRYGILFLATLICGTMSVPASAETIKLKSGKVINALITEYQEDCIKVNLDGITLTYYKDQIESIGVADLYKPFLNSAPSDPIDVTDKISNIIEKVSQSVVVIQSQKDNSALEGTGFFISANGLVATNLHVVFKARSIVVRTKSGKTFPVQFIVNFNDELDICVLKIDTTDAPALELGDSDHLKTGQILFTIGHREGSLYQTSSGPFIEKSVIDGEKTLQTRMVTGHGNSGGPILDQEGHIVGISKAFSPNFGNNFGIPINEAKKFLNYQTPVTVEDFNQQISPANELTYAGQGAFLAGKYGEALIDFKQALSIDPNYLKALIGTAKAYTAMYMNNDAFTAWQEVNNRDPNNIQAYIHLGKISISRNLLEAGINYLQKAAKLEPATKEIYADLGFAFGQRGMLDDAIKAYKKAIELNPHDADSMYNLAVAYFNKHDVTLAKEYCKKAQNLGYTVPESLLNQLEHSQEFGSIFKLKQNQ